MKKIITITAAAVLSLTGFGANAFAHEEDQNAQDRAEQGRVQQSVYDRGGIRNDNEEEQVYDSRDRGDHRRFGRGRDEIGRLQREVDHLNRMVDHVRGELRTYGGDRHIRSEYEHVRAESYQLSNQFRRGEQYYNRSRLRAQIEHMHGELHHIEQELHVRANDIYQWR